MRTLSRVFAVAGIVGAIAATGGTAAVAQRVSTFRAPVLELISVAPHTGNATTTGATPIMTAGASTQGDITEDLMRRSVAGVTATGISDYG